MTNREWLNSLTNKQFAKFLQTFKENDCDACSFFYGVGDGECSLCFEGYEKWLDMEHDDEGWEERDYRYCV